MKFPQLTATQRGLLRLVAQAPLIRFESPSEDPDMLELVDAALVEGSVGWVDGERMWTYRPTRYGRDVALDLVDGS